MSLASRRPAPLFYNRSALTSTKPVPVQFAILGNRGLHFRGASGRAGE
jgi:hypothetical protein